MYRLKTLPFKPTLEARLVIFELRKEMFSINLYNKVLKVEPLLCVVKYQDYFTVKIEIG